MRIGAKLPNSGPLPIERGVPEMARALEQAGYDSLWVSDHIVLPETIGSRYPFSADGRATWATDTPYLDALIVLALAAAVTERVRLGTAVLVLALRNPVEFAKQAASIDVASRGRLELAVGAGWLAEEFDALNVPFKTRGTRMVEWMEIARACWGGRPAGRSSERYTLPEGILSLPRPAHTVPLMVGGHSPVALRRAGTVGDGWLAQQPASALDPDELVAGIETMRAAAREAGLADEPPRVVLRIVESLGRPELVAQNLGALARAGVEEVIVDVPVEQEAAARDLEVLRAGGRMSLLAGRRALVTGGGSGIGAAVVARLAGEGAGGVVLDLPAALAGATLPDGWSGVEIDLRDDDGTAAAFAQAGEVEPELDLLVAAAGVVPSWATVAEIDLAEWDAVMAVNARGLVATLKHASPRIRDDGAVVVIASLNSWRGDGNLMTYTASKHAALGVVRSAALDLGRRGIRVNGVAPGPIATDALLQRMARREAAGGLPVPDALAQAASGTALGRIATTGDVAAATLFLATDLAGGVTGHLLPVDGGLS